MWHRQMVLVNSMGVSARKEVMSRLDSFNVVIPSFKCTFTFDLAVATDEVTEELSLS